VRAVILCLAVLGASARAADRVDEPGAVAWIVGETNAFRRANRVDALRMSPALETAARRFAEYMAANDRYGHDADGRTPAERARAHGYAYCAVAENIAMQFSSAGFATDDLAARFLDGWQKSPEHRRNLLMARMVDIGVGVARSERSGRWYAVQLFGRPQSLSARFELLNQAGASIRYELDGTEYTLPARVTRTHRGCFGGQVTLLGPDGAPAAAVEPRDGARYTALRDAAGALQLQPAASAGRAGR
jgi:hypothetical protein